MTVRRAVVIAAIGTAALAVGVTGLVAWRLRATLPTAGEAR